MPTRVLETPGKCPVCGGPANSPHHIKPVSVGGTNAPMNKVKLCERCHDIVEMIYDETGAEYSPSLIQYIRLSCDLAPIIGFPVAKARRRTLRSMDKRYTSDSIELCINCGIRFRQRKPDDILCYACMCWFGSVYEFMRITAVEAALLASLGRSS